MRGRLLRLSVMCAAIGWGAAGGAWAARADDCADNPETTGLSRTIAIESGNGPLLGKLQYDRTAPLKNKEVVLTFDDGPHPQYTRNILDVLDKHCVKATFFSVGKMALAYPQALKEVIARGHTVGAHTFSHPMDMSKLPLDEAKLEIEKGFAAVTQAAGVPVAPFFRFPGLNDSRDLDAYLASRDISIWSVDVVSNDTGPNMSPQKLVGNVIGRLNHSGKGIILFHDLKRVTAESLDLVLTMLKAQGYKVVHVVSNTVYTPNPDMVARPVPGRQGLRPASFTGGGKGRAGGDNPASADGKAGRNEFIRTDFIHIDTSGSGSPVGSGSAVRQ